MTKTTTVRDAQGNIVSTTTTKGGCGSGCLWVLLVGIVVGGPWAWFPHWLAILVYIFEGIIALGLLATKGAEWWQRFGARKGSA
ncbi:MAG: hypothetical protein ACRENX_07495 [Candidatus Dormibacteria bacterium]